MSSSLKDARSDELRNGQRWDVDVMRLGRWVSGDEVASQGGELIPSTSVAPWRWQCAVGHWHRRNHGHSKSDDRLLRRSFHNEESRRLGISITFINQPDVDPSPTPRCMITAPTPGLPDVGSHSFVCGEVEVLQSQAIPTFRNADAPYRVRLPHEWAALRCDRPLFRGVHGICK